MDSAEAILSDIRQLPDTDVKVVLHRNPAMIERENPYVLLLAENIADGVPAERISIGRDGASDIVSFLEAGTPGVEFGPVGAGHHGPEEWVSRGWGEGGQPMSWATRGAKWSSGGVR